MADEWPFTDKPRTGLPWLLARHAISILENPQFCARLNFYRPNRNRTCASINQGFDVCFAIDCDSIAVGHMYMYAYWWFRLDLWSPRVTSLI